MNRKKKIKLAPIFLNENQITGEVSEGYTYDQLVSFARVHGFKAFTEGQLRQYLKQCKKSCKPKVNDDLQRGFGMIYFSEKLKGAPMEIKAFVLDLLHHTSHHNVIVKASGRHPVRTLNDLRELMGINKRTWERKYSKPIKELDLMRPLKTPNGRVYVVNPFYISKNREVCTETFLAFGDYIKKDLHPAQYELLVRTMGYDNQL